MSTLIRHLRRPTGSPSRAARGNPSFAGTTFCDACGQVCTAQGRSASQLEHARLQVLQLSPIR